MNKSLHLAFLATAMATTSTIAVAKPPAPAPAPVPQFIGHDSGTFRISGAADGSLFEVTLDPGTYVITGKIDTSGPKNYNLTGATLTAGTFSDTFENSNADHYFENPWTFTILRDTTLLLEVNTNKKNTGSYAGTLTVTGSPLVSAVPETGTAALLLAGLGVLSIAARRRRA